MKKIPLYFLVISLVFPFASPARAFTYDPGLIIQDADLFAYGSMNVEEIQDFLDEHSGVLKNYFDIDIDGHLKTAAMIIHDAALRNRVNPRYLLVLLQKEQGLITDPEPYDTQISWATGYALCDSCSPEHPIVMKFKGFSKQLDHAAARTRYFVENIDQFYYKPGATYTINGQEVFIKNSSTAALYNYTPHIQGNKLFARLWDSWFGTLLSYPDGSLLQAYGEPGVWLLRNGVRHPFTSLSALTTRYNKENIIQVPLQALEQYPTGSPIAYPEQSILRLANGQVYLLVDNERRLIADDFVFRQLGYTEDEVVDVTPAELDFFKEGAPITSASLEPLGSLIQDPETYGIYFVKNGVKSPLVAPELLTLNFPNLRVRKGTVEELSRYTKGAPVMLKDGYLVKSPSDPTVYVISNGKKHPIDSEYTFNSLGYKWDRIQTISDQLLILHQTGDMITVSSPITDEEASEMADEHQQSL